MEGDNGQRRDHRTALVQLGNVEDAVMALIVSRGRRRRGRLGLLAAGVRLVVDLSHGASF